MRRTLGVLLAMAAAGFHSAAQASLPVPYAMVGCVSNGSFVVSGETRAELPAIAAIEGKTIRVEGYLSPGDRFSATAVFVVDEVCREELSARYFLCDPCRTLPGMPQTMIPPQPGTRVTLPPEVIRRFDSPPRPEQERSAPSVPID